ncbi:MAG: hypothetical protein AVDCRST_MAG64-1182, partial [uncultured Phycisphaerae bacterium]
AATVHPTALVDRDADARRAGGRVPAGRRAAAVGAGGAAARRQAGVPRAQEAAGQD